MELSEPEIVDIKSLYGFRKQLNILIEEKSIRAKSVPLAVKSLEHQLLEGFCKEVKLFVCHVFLSVFRICC